MLGGLRGCRTTPLVMLTADEHWHGCVRQDAHSFAAQEQSRKSSTTVRCHDDQVAAASVGDLDNGSAGYW